MDKRFLTVLLLMAVCVSASAQLASMPRRYTSGDFPTGQDLQANFEWVVDLVNQASETADIATTATRLTNLETLTTTHTLQIATLTADVSALQAQSVDYVASYSSNSAATDALLIWDSTGGSYYEAIAAQGAVKYDAEIVYISVNNYGGYRLSGVIAGSPGTGTYDIGSEVEEYWHYPESSTSGITVVASHSANGSGGIRFKLIASHPASISFKANARVKFTGATF